MMGAKQKKTAVKQTFTFPAFSFDKIFFTRLFIEPYENKISDFFSHNTLII